MGDRSSTSLRLQASRLPAAALLSVMSLIWGLTWIAIKLGVEETPPLFFAGTRFVAAGFLLLLIFRRRLDWRLFASQWRALLLVSAFLITLCYGPLFWGMQHTPSGVAGVVNLSLLPVGLLLIGVALRVETLTVVKSLGVLLGVIGLAGLFWPQLASSEPARAAGVGAIAIGTLSACFGSVLMRLWLSETHRGATSGVILLAGGVGLLGLSFLLEPISWNTWRDLLAPGVLGSWLFLVLAGSIVAFTLYLHLIAVWGPLKAGLYAFISPVIALAAGYLIFGERLGMGQIAAASVLIAAAALVSFPSKNAGRNLTDGRRQLQGVRND